MKIYISGPISNNDTYMEDFEKAEEYLHKVHPDVDIINPALVNSHLPKSTTHEEYMKMSFLMLDMCEIIYLLKGWDKSKGACMEYGYALAKDKVLMFEEETE